MQRKTKNQDIEDAGHTAGFDLDIESEEVLRHIRDTFATDSSIRFDLDISAFEKMSQWRDATE